MTIHQFENINNVIPNRSLLIFNNSQVIDVRVKTIKKHTHGKVEIFILKIVDEYSADCLLKFNGKRKLEKKLNLKIFNKYYQKCKRWIQNKIFFTFRTDNQ